MGRSLAAGLAASVGTTLIGLLVVPLYLGHLGLEAYGVVAFFVAVQGLLQVLDLGIGPTLGREVSRRQALGDLAGAGRLLHAMAVPTWGLGAALGAALALAAPALAGGWLRTRDLPVEAVTSAIRLMGLAVACRWPLALYQAALLGAGRQALSSGLALAATAATGLGGVAVLALASPTVGALLLWQAGAWLAATLLARAAAWRALGRPSGLRFDAAELRRVWRFSAALTVVAVQALAFTHLDRALLSRMLPLDAFGGYALAATVASGLYLVVTPFSGALYPRFSALAAAGDQAALRAQYRLATRALSLCLFPLALVLVFFAGDVVQAWTGDAALAAGLAPVVAALAGGSALHGIMHLQYALQLAEGQPRLPVLVNTPLLVVFVPLLVVLTRAMGALGGGLAWLALHVLYVALGTWLTHRRLLVGLGARWLAEDVGVPLAISLLVGLGGRALARGLGWGGWAGVGAAAGLAALALGLGVAASPQVRAALRAELRGQGGAATG